jgi:hypothetical protein
MEITGNLGLDFKLKFRWHSLILRQQAACGCFPDMQFRETTTQQGTHMHIPSPLAPTLA